QLLPDRERTPFAFDGLGKPFDPTASGHRVRHLVATDVAVIEPLSQKAGQVLGTAVRFARKRDHGHRSYSTDTGKGLSWLVEETPPARRVESRPAMMASPARNNRVW